LKIFTVIFDQFNLSLLNKSVNFLCYGPQTFEYSHQVKWFTSDKEKDECFWEDKQCIQSR